MPGRLLTALPEAIRDVPGFQLLLSVLALDFYLLRLHEAADAAGKDLDLVLLHQARNALAELVHDLVAALGGLLVVELDIPDLHPELLGVPDVV